MFRVVTKSENTPSTIKKNDKIIPEEKKVEKEPPNKNKIDLRYKPDPYMDLIDIEEYKPVINETVKKELENQIIIYDKNTNEWKVINESDSYLYNF